MKWASLELLKFTLGYNVERNETKENEKKMRFSVKYFIFFNFSSSTSEPSVNFDNSKLSYLGANSLHCSYKLNMCI